MLKTNSQGFQALYILLGVNLISLGVFNFTDTNNPKLSSIGSGANVAYYSINYTPYQMSVIIDTTIHNCLSFKQYINYLYKINKPILKLNLLK